MHRIFLVVPCLAIACSSGDDPTPSTQSKTFPADVASKAIVDYKKNALANYDEVLAGAKALKIAIDTFVATPNEANFEAARKAWIAARVPYGPSEAHRFYDGPIDNPETGPEGEINGWPLDEFHIDYTRDTPTSGTINDPKVEITKETIADANERDGEKAITSGYHAIEFLLWGQDDAKAGTGPGKRPYTDFVDGGTAANQARRRAYLKAAAELLVEDLESVRAEWAGAFGAKFGVEPLDRAMEPDAKKEAIGKLLRAIGSLAKAELSGERMTVAFKNRSQEDEHSCFSDNTATDLLGNGLGIENVWLGRYGSFDGVGLDEIVRVADAQLAQKTTTDIATAVAKLKKLDELQKAGTPIDVVLSSPDGSEARTAMLQAVNALKVVGDDVEKSAAALGLSVQIEKPSEEL